MTDLRKAAEMALEALNDDPKMLGDWLDNLKTAREALRQALAQPEQKREWVGLTDDELKALCDEWQIIYGGYVRPFAETIEAKLKEKNGGQVQNT